MTAQAAAGAPGTVASAAPSPAPPASITSVLAHPSLSGARVGVAAVSLPDGELLFAEGADDLLAPASVAKIFTAATALWRLGPHFRWRTPIAHDGVRSGDSIDGNLWVLGRGAPDLVEEILFVTATAIHDLGLEHIRGDLIVDDRYFDDVRYPEGWPGGRQVREAYHAPVSALMANFAAVRVGREWEAVDDPALHFGERLREILAMTGVEIGGAVRRPTSEESARYPMHGIVGDETGSSPLPTGLSSLHVIRSEPLGRIAMDINKYSNNVMAESVLKSLGAIEYGSPGTTQKGLAVVARFMDEVLGVPLNSYVLADGSGLSRLDRVTPRQILGLLELAYDDFHLGPELVASLKLSGLDGWSPAAFRHAPLVGELRVKSGHIRGVNTLAGFVHGASGRTMAFCVMVNDHRSQQWEIDQRMAEIADALIAEF
jgi:D-alanyl-D-alanine carboxypeptidase/D-alanyl-D-alanine-endopeptidase (penicillin-binding protein 4)